MSLEQIVRPFVGEDVTPKKEFTQGGQSSSMVRLAIGTVGGTKTFSFSGSSTLSSYMAAVHTEKPSDAFDMTTGKVKSS